VPVEHKSKDPKDCKDNKDMKKDTKDTAESASPPFRGVARRQLREWADDAPAGADLAPREALAILKTLDAPVGPLETMIDESIAGRYS